jgi:predicted nuclease of restriction endonuclease-like (RecB) superfamily
MKRKPRQASKASPVYERIRQILESAKTNVARSVNTTQVVANWLIGREIVEEEQKGKSRADYGRQLIEGLSKRITKDFGSGYSIQSLFYMIQFYRLYPDLLSSSEIFHAVRGELSDLRNQIMPPIFHALRGKSSREIPHALRAELNAGTISDAVHRKLRINQTPEDQPILYAVSKGSGHEISHALRDESWQPGQLHPNLSWTHYRTLLRVDKSEVRAFYEIEAIKNNWSARELERQINSLLYERLALSRDKKGLMKLATKGHEIQKPAYVFKDPIVIEFLGLPESPKLVESDLEAALIGNLQAFLLEMGKGFAFVARQQRLTLDGDHFYIDLVFYHTILKCYVIIELKNGKLTHQDLGQLQLYVNYYDRECRTKGDGPTLGLILCTDKNDTVVKYTLGTDQQKAIFASRYKLHLPTAAELRAEIRREVESLAGQIKTGGRE